MSAEANKQAIRRIIDEAWNNGKLEAVDQLVDSNYVGHDASWPQPIRGPGGFKQWVSAARILFPDFHISIEDLIGEGDSVAARIVMRGTHKGSLPGFPPATGKQVFFSGILIRRFAGGKLVAGWDISDVMGLMQQLGVTQSSK